MTKLNSTVFSQTTFYVDIRDTIIIPVCTVVALFVGIHVHNEMAGLCLYVMAVDDYKY